MCVQQHITMFDWQELTIIVNLVDLRICAVE